MNGPLTCPTCKGSGYVEECKTDAVCQTCEGYGSLEDSIAGLRERIEDLEAELAQLKESTQ